MSKKLLEKTINKSSDRDIGDFKLLFEDDKTLITHWTIEPGKQTGWHLHDYDYVTIQQSYGTLYLEHSDGTTREVKYTPGTTRSVKSPVEHNAINIGDVDIEVIEIEYKY